ncbi:MAG: SDR family oxidoreductase [Candidatus Moraniibacteriota bacterium]
MNIKDSVIIITGASGGIGLALARTLALQGAKVVLAARSADKLSALEHEIPGSFSVPTDMHKPEDIENLVAKTVEHFGRVDILVNNAGQGLSAPVETINLDDYRSIMDLNVFSVVRAMQAVIPLMRKQGGGMIVNISSMVSKNLYPGLAAYASTKYALNAISLTARAELAPDKIVVSVFHPKMTATEFGQNSRGARYVLPEGAPAPVVDTAEEVAAAIAKQIESEDAEAMM